MFHQGSGVVWMEGTQGLSKQSYLQLEQSVELVATLIQEIMLFCILVDLLTQWPESRFFV